MTMLGVVVVVPLVLWAAGYALLRRLSGAPAEWTAVAALPIAGLLQGYAAFAAGRLTADPALWNRAFLVAALLLAVQGMRRAWAERAEIAGPVGVQACVYLLLVLSLCALPVYAGVGWWGDWWYYYDVAGRFAVADGDMHARVFDAFVPAGRPMLLIWQLAAMRSALEAAYWAGQCVALTYAAPLAGVAWLFLRRHVPAHIVAPAAVLLCLMPGPWWTATMLWPKVQATVPLFLGWWLATAETPADRRPPLLAWILMATAVLTHVMPVSYVLVAGILLVARRWRVSPGDGLRTAGVAVACATVVLGPWLVWLAMTYSLGDIVQGQYVQAPGVPRALVNMARWAGNLAFSSVPARLLQAVAGRSDLPVPQSLLQGYMLNGFGVVLLTGSAALLAGIRRAPPTLARPRAVFLVATGLSVVLLAQAHWAQPESIYTLPVLRAALWIARGGVLLLVVGVAIVGLRSQGFAPADPVDPFWWVALGTLLPPVIQPATWPMGILPSAMLPAAVALSLVVLRRIGEAPGARAWLALLGAESVALVTWYLTQVQRGAAWTQDDNHMLKTAHGALTLYDVSPLPPLVFATAALVALAWLLKRGESAPSL